jgi:hypothetical protein
MLNELYIESNDSEGRMIIKKMSSFASDSFGIDVASVTSNSAIKFKRKSDLTKPLSGTKSRISIKGEN